MKFSILNSGYNNTQIVEGYVELIIENFEDIVYINVCEVTSSNGHETYMTLNLFGQNDDYRAKLLGIIDCTKIDDDNYEINDDTLVTDLFSIYGNNGN